MTNAEKYKDAIMAQMCKTGDWALNKSGEITPCEYARCADCQIRIIHQGRCADGKKEWLNAEVKKAFSEKDKEVLQRDVENLTRTLEKGATEFQEVQHRAEVAECALQKFAEYITCEDCPFFSDCASSEKMGHPIHSNRCFSEYLKQAEKELQEEEK